MMNFIEENINLIILICVGLITIINTINIIGIMVTLDFLEKEKE